jgi:pimeloyl-ACP methyl ester carboxylesterase
MECVVRDITFNYEDIGSGRPLLALHGWPLDHRHMLSALEPVFAQRPGWRRIYPDLPGFGHTAAPEWLCSHDQMVELASELMEAVAPGERFAVAGTSFGGYLARGMVRRRGEDLDGVLLTVPYFPANERRGTLPEHRVLREDADFVAALQPGEEADIVVMQSMELLDEFRRSIFPPMPLHDAVFGDRMSAHFSYELDPLEPPFPAPTLIVTGRFDNWCGYEEGFRILPSFPRATYAVLDCAGHALPTEQKTLFHALVSNWLDRVEAYAGDRGAD